MKESAELKKVSLFPGVVGKCGDSFLKVQKVSEEEKDDFGSRKAEKGCYFPE